MKAAHSRKSGLKGKKNIPITFRWRREIQDFEWDRKIRRYVMAVSFILERHADADGKNVYPSVGTIADLAGIGIAKVREALKAMEDPDAGFIRTYSKTRYGTKLRRLVYKNHDIEVGDTRSTSNSETRSTTKRTQGTLGKSPTRTESLSRSAKSPKATVAPRSATPKPIISAPKVEVDLVAVERKEHRASGRSNLGKLQARANSVVTKSDAQIIAERLRIQSDVDVILESHLNGVHIFEDFYRSWDHKEQEIRAIFDAVYNDHDLFSHVCKTVQNFDRKSWIAVAKEMEYARWLTFERRDEIRAFLHLTSCRALSEFADAIIRYRRFDDFVRYDCKTDDLDSLTVEQIRNRFYLVSEMIRKDIRGVENQTATAWSVSVSATRTSGDEMIVGKIVETVETSSTLERW